MVEGRADRILDAAAELLVRYGYRKVTVEDVAAQAGVGKGTVYLHWRTKQQVFEALVIRESVGFVEHLVAGLRADATMLLPHRLHSTNYLEVMARPVLKALVTGDASDLQERIFDGAMRGQELLTVERVVDVMVRHGLYRDDIPNLRYALTASIGGFYLFEQVDRAAAGLEPRERADAIAHVVRNAFEPPEPPRREALAAAAAEAIALLAGLLPPYWELIYGYDRKDRTP